MADYRGTTAVTGLGWTATSLYAARLEGPLAWVFGAEGQGVRAELLADARLKMQDSDAGCRRVAECRRGGGGLPVRGCSAALGVVLAGSGQALPSQCNIQMTGR